MGKTVVTVDGNNFCINSALTYSDNPECPVEHHGLLMNARFVQGIFQDKADPDRFHRYGKTWDPQKNTEDLIQALPQWKDAGLLGFTLGLQGGMPVLTIKNSTIDNSPFSPDGKTIEPECLIQLDKVITAADSLGMVVIVSILYEGQIHRLPTLEAVFAAVKTASNALRDKGYTNVIIEVANEYRVGEFEKRPDVIHSMCDLIAVAQKESGGLLVGSSSGGLCFDNDVVTSSDVVLVHGNGGTRESYHRFIKQVQKIVPNKPILCNEDSPRFSHLSVAFQTHTSWGYYNTHTKQEVPVYWGITKGEDSFFAKRLSEQLGMHWNNEHSKDQFFLQGLGNHETYDNLQWIRLASLYPEKIDYVEFYRNGEYLGISYEEPFYLNSIETWYQEGLPLTGKKEYWEAKVYLHTGRVVSVLGERTP